MARKDAWTFELENPDLTATISWRDIVKAAVWRVEQHEAVRVMRGFVEFDRPQAESAIRIQVPHARYAMRHLRLEDARAEFEEMGKEKIVDGPWTYERPIPDDTAGAATHAPLPRALSEGELRAVVATIHAHYASIIGDLKHDISQMREDVRELRKELKVKAKNHATPSQAGTVNITFTDSSILVNQDNRVQINNFGSEDVSYLTADPELLHQRLLRRGDGVIQTIEDIHFHPGHPENNNVRVRSMKRGTAEIKRGDEWEIAPLDEVARKMLLKSVHLLTSRIQRDDEYRDRLLEDHNDVFDWTLRFWSKPVNNPLAEKAKILLANKTRRCGEKLEAE